MKWDDGLDRRVQEEGGVGGEDVRETKEENCDYVSTDRRSDRDFY